MANPNVRLKRSSVAGKRPEISQVDMGELALNTNDGRLFTRKYNVGIGSTVTLLNPWTENIGGSVYYNDGNVGVGTTNPTDKLTVRGNVSISSTVGIGTIIDIIPYDTLNSGTLSFEGSAGQLFSITNNLTTGSIFSVNDVSGIPSIDVNANGTIQLGPYGGNVGIATTNPTEKLEVNGNIKANNFFKGTTPLITGVGISSNSTRVSTAITDFNFVGAQVTAGLTTATVTIVKVLTVGRRDTSAATINAVGTGITMLLRSGSVATLTF